MPSPSPQQLSLSRMAYDGSYYYLFQQPVSSWERDQIIPIVMDGEEEDRSTGYLEDAVAGWTASRFKRRRMVLFHEPDDRFEDILQEFWNWSSDLHLLEGNTKDRITVGEGGPEPAVVGKSSTEGTDNGSELTNVYYRDSSPENSAKKKRREVVVGVVYPFTVVKPADVDGRVTLDAINKKILSRPTRPVRHPVGEFACLPCVTAIAGPGLSGKAVVSLTRVHTRGRGTITIIRTKG